jgi:hypothetical protein
MGRLGNYMVILHRRTDSLVSRLGARRETHWSHFQADVISPAAIQFMRRGDGCSGLADRQRVEARCGYADSFASTIFSGSLFLFGAGPNVALEIRAGGSFAHHARTPSGSTPVIECVPPEARSKSRLEGEAGRFAVELECPVI